MGGSTSIYYRREQSHEQEMGRFTAWNGLKANKRLILAFQEHLFAGSTKQYRVSKVMMHLRKLCDMEPTLDLSRASKTEIRSLVARINTSSFWAPETQRDYKRILKHFYGWYEEEDPRLLGSPEDRSTATTLYKYLRREVKTPKPRKSIGADTVITDEDCQVLITKGCVTPLERALLATFHNSGGRVGEVLGLKIQDYQRKGQYSTLRLDGKTGERIVPVLQAIPWIEQWLTNHPFKDDPQSPMWVSTHPGKGLKPLRYIGASKLLQRVFIRAGYATASTKEYRDRRNGHVIRISKPTNLSRPCNPHWFRHSRATIWSKEFSHAVICKLMGWEHGSKQARNYEHLSGTDIESDFQRKHGILPASEVKPIAQFCRCGSTNTANARYCFKCGSPLNVSIAMQDEQLKSKAIEEALSWLMSDPELRKRFEIYQRHGRKNTE